MTTDTKSKAIKVILVFLVIVLAAAYSECQRRQPQIVYVTPPRPDAYIHSFYNYPVEDNTVRTALALKNRGASGLITVEYNAGGGFFQVKQYHIKAGEMKNIDEVWNVPSEYNYVQCKILKQEILD